MITIRIIVFRPGSAPAAELIRYREADVPQLKPPTRTRAPVFGAVCDCGYASGIAGS
jgi:hypothetical protein